MFFKKLISDDLRENVSLTNPESGPKTDFYLFGFVLALSDCGILAIAS